MVVKLSGEAWHILRNQSDATCSNQNAGSGFLPVPLSNMLIGNRDECGQSLRFETSRLLRCLFGRQMRGNTRTRCVRVIELWISLTWNNVSESAP